jgi:hypothetical protein
MKIAGIIEMKLLVIIYLLLTICDWAK